MQNVPTKYPQRVRVKEPNRNTEAGPLLDCSEGSRVEGLSAALRESERRFAAELEDSKLLQSISAEIIHEDDLAALNAKIMDAAVAIMRSDFASMQQLYPERGETGELLLLAHRGFPLESAEAWKWVRTDSGCTCGEALRTGRRAVANDVDTCPFIAGTKGHATYRSMGIRAVQSTPLFARGGAMLGMISTHWRQPHEPSERDLRLLDILARQAADLIERRIAHAELTRLKDSLARQNETLEETVAERTAKLREMVTELESFSYSIAHDLRAPLRSLQGYGDLLAEKYLDKLDAEGQGFLRRLTQSAARMDHLVRDVLNYSKLVRAELPQVAIEVEPLLRGIIDTYPSLQHPETGIVLEGPFPKVLGNEAALTQCFSNLLGNAVKFVAPGVKPRVRAWAEASHDRVRILVQDNGIGIPAEQHERIFAIFQRLSRNYEGTGIGLAIVRKAAERMGGRVGLESEPGKGSIFWIELKRADTDNPVSPDIVPAGKAAEQQHADLHLAEVPR
jgi:signal transduction histidine kinase